MRKFLHRRGDLLAVAALGIMTLAFFWKIALTNLILTGLDLFTYFYPYRAYAAEALRRGHLPLWNPYLFMGVPLLANVQAAVFYPLNWVLAWLPAPKMVAWSIVLHIFLAGLFAYLYARLSVGLSRCGALVAAIILALGGFVGAQVEHINQLNASAWLPLAFLLFDLASGRKGAAKRASHSIGVPALACLGLVVGLQLVAGHTQSAYISLFALGVYALFPAIKGLWERELRGLRGEIGRRLLIYLAAVAIGGALAAVQLLPTWELSRLSIRSGGLSYRDAVSFSLKPRLLLLSFLPTFGGEKVFSEYVAYVGVTGLLLALTGALFSKRNKARPFLIFLTALGLFLALGGYNPFYFVLYKLVPGFSLFRAPARWLYLYAFGAAMLGGLGADFLASPLFEKAEELGCGVRELPRLVSRRLLAAAGALSTLALLFSPFLALPTPVTLAAWLTLAAAATALIVLQVRWGRPYAPYALLALLCFELFAASRGLAYNRPTAPEAYSSLRTAPTHLLVDRGLYRFLSISDLTFDPGDLGEIELIFKDQLPAEAIYDYVVATKQKEVLVPNLPLLYKLQSVDGYDGGVLPLARYVELARLLLAEPLPDGRLGEQLTEMPPSRLLGLLNVRYVIADKVRDVWLDGVYYDLGHEAILGPGEKFQVADLPHFAATALGLVSHLEGAQDLAQGTPVAEVLVADDRGRVQRHLLRAGLDTAEGGYGAAVAHRKARIARRSPRGSDYFTRLGLGSAVVPRRISIRYLAPAGRLHLRGASLVDERTGTFVPLIVSTRGRFRLVHSGDVKVYQNLDNLPRAFVVHRARVLDDEAAIAAMGDETFRPGEEVILAEGEPLEGGGGRDEVEIVLYQPERVVVEAHLAGEGYLVLTDAHYPGWRALVDGREVPIHRADVLFRAVRLPAGRHRVEFVYDPLSLKIGAVISLAALLGVVAVLARPAAAALKRLLKKSHAERR